MPRPESEISRGREDPERKSLEKGTRKMRNREEKKTGRNHGGRTDSYFFIWK